MAIVSGSANHLTWDYLMLPEAERNRLTALGREGWELVGVGGNSDERLLYLKRPGADFRERVTLDQRSRYYASTGLDPRDRPDRSTE